MSNRLVALIAVLVVLLLGAIIIATELTGTVDSGTYVIKQAAGSGAMTAIMKPGMYSKTFATVTEWPIAETFYFTSVDEDKKDSEDVKSYGSIGVRFNDGGVCAISGTCRLDMPRSEDEAINLVTKLGYKNHEQVEQKLILPVIRRAVIMTANLMSSKDSYSDRRADFFNYAWDQVANGIYQTIDKEVDEPDPITGVMVKHVRKDIARDSSGVALREQNPLAGTGITLSVFEIKAFDYEDKVKAQIATQQDAIMAVQTSRANAQRAQQDMITAEANGKAVVMKAQYEELEKKTRAQVQAEQAQQVATIGAQQQVDVSVLAKQQALVMANQQLEVAAIDLKAATLAKQKAIELATGESEAKKMILAADGALAAKLDAYNKAQEVWAQAFATRRVPGIVFGGNAGTGAMNDAQEFMQLMTVKAAKDLALDMTLRGQTAEQK